MAVNLIDLEHTTQLWCISLLSQTRIIQVFDNSFPRDYAVLKLYFQTMEVKERRMFKDNYFDFAGKQVHGFFRYSQVFSIHFLYFLLSFRQGGWNLGLDFGCLNVYTCGVSVFRHPTAYDSHHEDNGDL